MINVLLDQISAERAGRTTTARSLAGEYNSLLATHNRQVADYNAALGKLRAFLP